MRTIIRRSEVKRRTGNPSDATLWRWERDGKFPQRVQLTERGAVGWYEDEVDAWVAARVRGGGKRPPEQRSGDHPEPPAAA